MISEIFRPVASPGSQRVITPRFLLRVGGLPHDTIDSLRFHETIAWQEELLTLEHQLLQQKESLVDMLHTQVNLHKEEQALRRQLINLKRQVFNMHFPHGTQDARLIAASLDGSEQEQLIAWLEQWERFQQERARGERIVAQEHQQKRALLKEIVQETDFRKGILLSSPLLYQAMQHYIACDNAHPNREARTVERSLLEYLLRTIHKTSPFSTFTPVCIGQFTDQHDAADELWMSNEQNTIDPATSNTGAIELVIDDMRKHSFTRLNMLVLSRLSTLILASQAVRKHLRVRLTTGWRRENGTIRYIRRKPMLDNPDSDAALPLDYIQEHVIKLPAGTLLNSLIAIMQDGHEEHLSALIGRLHSNDDQQRAEAVIEEYLQHLLRLGFLIVPTLQVDIHAPRPLDAYAEQLTTIDTLQTDALAATLQDIAGLIDSYAYASLEKRAALVEQVRTLLQQASSILGHSAQALVLPRTLIYEDTTIAPDKLSISKEQWDGIFTDLDELQRILPVFDTRFAFRVLTRGYFQARYGRGQRCDDFLAFAERFNSEFLRNAQHDARETSAFDQDGSFQGRENYFGQPEIDAINEARKDAIAQMQRAYQAHEDDAEVVLHDDFVHKLSALVPTCDLQSNTFFSQFAQIGQQPSLIVNQIYPGLTLMFSRFAYCFAQQPEVVSTLRETLLRLQTPGMVFAELKGGYDATNLNLHPVVTPYELVCPGEISTRPLAEQIPMEDLCIQDDERTGRLLLYSKRLQQEVVPLYLGFLTPMLLPEIQQVLLNFSYLSTAALDLWQGVQMQKSEHGTFYPRLRYKHLILQRATWKMAADSLPTRESGQSDADFYLCLTRWRRQHNLPAQVFVSPSPDTSSRQQNEDEQEEKAYQSYKPLFVDFENLFSVLLFETTVRKASQDFVLTEVLPAREHLWFEHDHRPHINEFVFEVSQKRGAYHG